MINSLIDQLQSPDPEARRSAVVALAKAKDPTALPALGRVYKEDPLPELRELALKAGRYIKQAQDAGQVPAASPIMGGPSVWGDYAQSAEMPPRTASQQGGMPPRTASQQAEMPPRTASQQAEMPPRTASKQQAARAKGYLDTAINYYSAGDRPRAVESLGRAFELDPLMHKELVATNLAQTLTGLGLQDAIALMRDPFQRKAFLASLAPPEVIAGGKAKRKRSEKMVTWIDVLLDLALYWLVFSIILTAILGLGIRVFVNHYGDQMIDATASNPTPLTHEDLDELKNLSLIGILFFSMAVSVSQSISVMVNSLAIHISATMMLGGKNTYVDFLHRYIPFLTGLILIFGVLIALILLLLDPAPGVANLLWTVTGVGGVLAICALAWQIGNIYGFAMPYGCAAMILSIIVAFLMTCMFNMVFSMLFGR